MTVIEIPVGIHTEHAGTLGVLYNLAAFEQEWAGQLHGPGIAPVLILLGTLMIDVTAFYRIQR